MRLHPGLLKWKNFCPLMGPIFFMLLHTLLSINFVKAKTPPNAELKTTVQKASPTSPGVKKMVGPLDIDFHEHVGCAENSLCDKKTGLHRKKWIEFIENLKKKSPPLTPQKLAQEIDRFRQKNGLPMEFLADHLAYQRYYPMLWDSPCKKHRHEDPKKEIYLGEAFIKHFKNKSAHVARMEEYHIIPLGELIQLDPIYVFDPQDFGPQKPLPKSTKINSYLVPRNELPTYIEKGKLVFIREAEGVFYGLKISAQGDLKVEAPGELPSEEVQEVACPKMTADQLALFQGPLQEKYFESVYCREIWDKTLKKKWVMMVPQICL